MNKEKEKCREKLKEIVDKKELYFTKRCNKSIDIAVLLALRKLDKNKERFLFNRIKYWINKKANKK